MSLPGRRISRTQNRGAQMMVNRAFQDARLLACGDSCRRCGKFLSYPKGVALYEEPYCEAEWLCDECYPESLDEDTEG